MHLGLHEQCAQILCDMAVKATYRRGFWTDVGGNFLNLRGASSVLAGLDWTEREQPRDEAATAKATSKRCCCTKTRWWRWA